MRKTVTGALRLHHKSFRNDWQLLKHREMIFSCNYVFILSAPVSCFLKVRVLLFQTQLVHSWRSRGELCCWKIKKGWMYYKQALKRKICLWKMVWVQVNSARLRKKRQRILLFGSSHDGKTTIYSWLCYFNFSVSSFGKQYILIVKAGDVSVYIVLIN